MLGFVCDIRLDMSFVLKSAVGSLAVRQLGFHMNCLLLSYPSLAFRRSYFTEWGATFLVQGKFAALTHIEI